MHSRINYFIEYIAKALVSKKKRFNLSSLGFLPDRLLKILLNQHSEKFALILADTWQLLGIELPIESVHPDIRGNILLFALIRHKQYNANALMLMRMLVLMNGFDIDYREQATGNTALSLAAKDGNAKVIGLLLQHNANINTTNNENETAVALAISGKKTTAIEILIAAGANLQVTDRYGHCLAELAAFHGDMNIMKLLMIFSSKIQLNKALLVAARLGDNHKIRELISCGAETTFTLKHETAFSIASEKFHHTSAAILAREYFKSYQLKRSRLGMFTGSIFGCSRTAKVNAANAMVHVLGLPVAEHHTLIDHLNAHSHLLKAHHRALHQGELGKIMMELLNTSAGNLKVNQFKLSF